jgi:hypothetical protein
MGEFNTSLHVLEYSLMNLVWIMVFPAFIISLVEYKNQKVIENNWKSTVKPKKQFVSVIDQVARHYNCTDTMELLTEGYARKGGQNTQPSQIQAHPTPPASIHTSKVSINTNKVIIKSKKKKKNKKSKNK